jgi:host factor-I protein
MSERINLQDQFLNTLRKEHMHCSVFLVNGIKLVGKIESFDQYMVLLRGNDQAVQAIFKHAISTISPAKQVSLGARESGNAFHHGIKSRDHRLLRLRVSATDMKTGAEWRPFSCQHKPDIDPHRDQPDRDAC